GGESGLDFYRRIIDEAHLFLKKNGLLALEIGDDQSDAVIVLLKNNGYEEIETIRDLGGHMRCLTGKLSGHKPGDINKLG
ncbi:MAG: hypothetical protein L6276_09780, partial [Acetobacterium sp.]|nr:hypothetical protein [Acetobacterium sp.]